MGNCEDFFEKIKKYFDFLFNEYGFLWLSNNEKTLGFNNCFILLESDNCSIEIVRDRGNILIGIGPKSKEESYYIDYIIDFLTGDNSGKIRKEEQMKYFESLDKSSLHDYLDHELISQAYKLKSYGREIFKLFQENNGKTTESKLKDFIKTCIEERMKKLKKPKNSLSTT